MRRRGKSGHPAKVRRENRPKARKAPISHASPTDLQGKLDRVTGELDDARQREIATSEVLRVISSSPGELEPVFEAMLENAVRICDAKFGNLFLREEGAFRFGATHGAPPAYADYLRGEQEFPIDPKLGLGQLVTTKEPYHLVDIAATPTFGNRLREATINLVGARTLIGVPMLKGGKVVGAIIIYRQEVRPFTDKQIELVKNFAAQAVIAIENTRLLNELRESLQQQTATADVLKVISSSPGNLEPVFQAILASATEICQTKFGTLNLFENNTFRNVALHNPPPQFRMRLGQILHPHPDSGLAHVARTKQIAHIEDIRTQKPYLEGNQAIVELADLAGARTQLSVPMLKEDALLGSMSIYRQEVRPFTDKQIELVQSFAAQAVIAIENTRLLNELRQRTDDLTEALEQQTATSEVLRVISSSPTNVQPVFDAIAESAVRLCDGQFSFVLRFDGKVMDFASCCGLSADGLDAFHSILPMPASEYTAAGRAIVRRAVVEIPDVETDPSYGAQAQGLAKAVTYRSIAAVPLLHEGNPIGAIAVARANAGSFPKRQIVLLQAFADQAVIAIANVRLFDEVQARTRELAKSLDDLRTTQ
ncbi:MAG: GAF domain-containing protein, partial [Pseudolabrys sp.]